MAVCLSRRNDADVVVSNGVRDHHFDFIHEAYRDLSVFAVVVVFIPAFYAVLIEKYLCSERKGNAMLLKIDGGFSAVPLELHFSMLLHL